MCFSLGGAAGGGSEFWIRLNRIVEFCKLLAYPNWTHLVPKRLQVAIRQKWLMTMDGHLRLFHGRSGRSGPGAGNSGALGCGIAEASTIRER